MPVDDSGRHGDGKEVNLNASSSAAADAGSLDWVPITPPASSRPVHWVQQTAAPASTGRDPSTENGACEPPAATRFHPSPDSLRRLPLNRSTPFILEQLTTSPPTAYASQNGVVGCRKVQDVRRSWLGGFDLPGNCSDQGNPAGHPLATDECSIWRSLRTTGRPKSCAAIVDGCTGLRSATTDG